jgi:tRNA(Arg) A34 adenosine deaminase TadA
MTDCVTKIPFSDLSNKQQNIVSRAVNEAEKADMLFRHGSVAVSCGRVLSGGHNHYRNKLRSRTLCSFHAEVDVLSRVLRGTYQQHRTTNPRFEGYCLQGAKGAKVAKVAQAA